ncbi:hypothetical protein GUJ93_ZPchr0012g21546 [Zizania palustris]|uniref:Uncharacterized protein n=1 Tax=Zizania palustris TaxID=103762 RepID=A0A8J5WPJ5_ZIZPA|nr:hypothetical protein GUJ93_ZPchr0012g21546 [Zizania palustris]
MRWREIGKRPGGSVTVTRPRVAVVGRHLHQHQQQQRWIVAAVIMTAAAGAEAEAECGKGVAFCAPSFGCPGLASARVGYRAPSRPGVVVAVSRAGCCAAGGGDDDDDARREYVRLRTSFSPVDYSLLYGCSEKRKFCTRHSCYKLV